MIEVGKHVKALLVPAAICLLASLCACNPSETGLTAADDPAAIQAPQGIERESTEADMGGMLEFTGVLDGEGIRQLDRYPRLLDRRRQIIARYDRVCDELGISHMLHHVKGMDSSDHLYLIRIPGADVTERNAVITEMAQKGVATNVHYKPLPMMTAYKAYGWDIKDFPNTYAYYENLVTLPLHTLLSDEDVAFICDTLKSVIHKAADHAG